MNINAFISELGIFRIKGNNVYIIIYKMFKAYKNLRASLVAQLVKNSPAMQETIVQFLGWKDQLEKIGFPLQFSWSSLVAQLIKNLPAAWESWGESLSWEDPLEKGMVTHPSILAWKIPWAA